MKKKIKDLVIGDKFKDSLECVLKVEKYSEVITSQIPGVKPKVKLYFETENGTKMFMFYNADREVEIVT